MAQIPEWIFKLAEISDYEYHFNRLKKFMNEDEMYNFLVVEAAELDIEEIKIPAISTSFLRHSMHSL